MSSNTAYVVLIAFMIGTVFFLSGYNNTRIKQLDARIEQLETGGHHGNAETDN